MSMAVRVRAWALVLAMGLVPAGGAAWAASAPSVVASIGPVHALVANVMAGVAEPTLLMPAGASPHTYALRPTDARAIDRADVVFWIGPSLETALVRPLAALAADARVVALLEAPGVTTLPARVGGVWEAHRHDEASEPEHHGHDHGHDHYHYHYHDHDHVHDLDAHVWLSIANARAMVRAIAATLSAADAGRAERYHANASAYDRSLAALEAELSAELQPVRAVPFVVFHDAYQYYEAAFGLSGVGSLTVSPDQRPGVRRLMEIQDRIRSRGAVCLFAEPQFEPSLVQTLVAGTGVATGVLDPLGSDLEPGPAFYHRLMRDLAGALKACLSRAE